MTTAGPIRRTAVALLRAAVAAVAAGCTALTPAPEPSPPPDAPFLLRADVVQALPPGSQFGQAAPIVITVDGRVLMGGAVPAIFPGPLLSPIDARPITAAGWTRILDLARDLGLLAGNGDFTGGAIPPGGQTIRIRLVAGGRLVELRGPAAADAVCANAPSCEPSPGTPEAFVAFWGRLLSLDAWLDGEIGRPVGYEPAGLAVLVGEPPAEDPQLSRPPVAWPGATPLASFGRPLGDGSGGRCGTVTGAELAAVAPAVRAASELTRWRDGAAGPLRGLTVRALLPGDEDPCAGLVAG